MAELRVQLFGPMLVFKQEHPVKLRTKQQALLLARLIVAEVTPSDRDDLCESLWPEAESANAKAYLRRAVKELRELGLDIRSGGGGLLLEAQSLESEVHQLRLKAPEQQALFGGDAILVGMDHPVADEVRQILLREFAPPRPALGQKSSQDLNPPAEVNSWRWLGKRLLQQQPSVALALTVEAWNSIIEELQSEELLAFLFRVAEANPERSPERVRLLAYIGRTALFLTRYGLCEKLSLEALEGAEEMGEQGTAAFALSVLSMLMLETRQWERGRQYGLRGIELATRTGDTLREFQCRCNLAGIQWHSLEFEASAENYRLCWEAAQTLETAEQASLIARANAAYIRAIFGTAIDFPVDPLTEIHFSRGYGGVAESYLQFSLAFERRDGPGAAAGAARLLELAAEDHMERYLAVALDCAAFAFVRRNLMNEAATCVRMGSRLRSQISHRRSPAESLAVRRHVQPPFFGRRIARLHVDWSTDNLDMLARRVADRLWEP